MYSCRPKISIATSTTGGLSTPLGRAKYPGMSPSATFIFVSPAVRPLVSVLMTSARTGPAASVYPAAAAADAVVKPRRENGATFVSPTISDASWGSAVMIDPPACGRHIQQIIRGEGKSRACEDSTQIRGRWRGFGTGGPAKKQGRRRSITPTALPAPDIKIGSRRPVNRILTRFFTGKCDPVHKRRKKSCGQLLGESWPRAIRSGTGRGGDVTGSRVSVISLSAVAGAGSGNRRAVVAKRDPYIRVALRLTLDKAVAGLGPGHDVLVLFF